MPKPIFQIRDKLLLCSLTSQAVGLTCNTNVCVSHENNVTKCSSTGNLTEHMTVHGADGAHYFNGEIRCLKRVKLGLATPKAFLN